MTGRRNRPEAPHRRHRAKLTKTGCVTGKYRYADKQSADQVRHTIQRDRDTTGLRSFYCARCCGWHLTSQREHGT